MKLSACWLENQIKAGYIEYDIYTILKIYKDMIKICKKDVIEK